jgi:triacylglycerol lipase
MYADLGQVTIMGESAGGWSVGVQLLAYNGRDDKLFARAISESGSIGFVAPYGTFESWAPIIANISAGVGCQNSTHLLDCLRAVPVQQLNAVINSTATVGAVYFANIDGDLVTKAAATQLQEGNFVRVPFLLGTNTDEGM